jgi:hypothetical protein
MVGPPTGTQHVIGPPAYISLAIGPHRPHDLSNTNQHPNFVYSTSKHGKRETVLLSYGGFCNGYITKWCLHNSTNMPHNDLVSRLLCDKR